VLCHAKVSRASDGSASPEDADNVQTRGQSAFSQRIEEQRIPAATWRAKYCLPLYHVVYECILERF